MTLELVSLHVPKTGGTSFLKALLDHYGDDLIVDHDHAPGLAANLKAPVMLPDHAKAVHGHFAGDRYRDFSDAFHVTFLRDPVEQVISTYFFWLTLPPSAHPLHQRLLTEMPDVVSFARYDTGGTLQGFFREVDPGCFDYVGFTDRRSLDCHELSRLLGLKSTRQFTRTRQYCRRISPSSASKWRPIPTRRRRSRTRCATTITIMTVSDRIGPEG